MVEFKTSMTKSELLEIAAANGIFADDSMTKAAIIDVLNAHNAQNPAEQPTTPAESAAEGGEGNSTTPGEKPAERPREGEEGAGGSGTGDGGGETPAEEATEGAGSGAENGEGNNPPHDEKPAEQPTGAAEGYDTFVYVGPSIPRGRLKENAVFRGTLSDVLAYLADAVEQYPQIPRLIVPTNRLAAFSVKVKTPGNIAHKYYSDIASAIRRGKEV